MRVTIPYKPRDLSVVPYAQNQTVRLIFRNKRLAGLTRDVFPCESLSNKGLGLRAFTDVEMFFHAPPPIVAPCAPHPP